MGLDDIKHRIKKPPSFYKVLAAALALHMAALHEPVSDIGQKVKDDVYGALDPAFATQRAFDDFKKLREKDPALREALKKELISKFERGEDISFKDFIFEGERAEFSMTPYEIQEAKRVLNEIVENLKAERPEIPNKEFLQKIVNVVFKSDKKDNYALTLTSFVRFLNRLKREGRAGNCDPRSTFFAIVLEELYPGRKNDIFLQNFYEGKARKQSGGHIQTLFRIQEEGKIYAFPSVTEISQEDWQETAIFTPKDRIAAYAGDPRFIKEVRVEKTYDPPVAPTQTEIERNPAWEDRLPMPPIKGTPRPYGSQDWGTKKDWVREKNLLEKDIEDEKNTLNEARRVGTVTEVDLLPEPISQEEIEKIIKEEEKKSSYRMVRLNSDLVTLTPEAVQFINSYAPFQRFASGPAYRMDLYSLPSRTLAEIPKLKGECLTIFAYHDRLPDAFLDHLDQLQVRLLSIARVTKGKELGFLNKATLEKLLMGSSLRKGKIMAIRFDGLALNEESARILAQSSRFNEVAFSFINTDDIVYGDGILNLLAQGKNDILIYARPEAFKTYAQQSPWLTLQPTGYGDKVLESPNGKLLIQLSNK